MRVYVHTSPGLRGVSDRIGHAHLIYGADSAATNASPFFVESSFTFSDARPQRIGSCLGFSGANCGVPTRIDRVCKTWPHSAPTHATTPTRHSIACS